MRRRRVMTPLNIQPIIIAQFKMSDRLTSLFDNVPGDEPVIKFETRGECETA